MDFDALGSETEAEGPSCTFTLGGRIWSCKQPKDVPYAVIKKLTRDDGGDTSVRVDGFFQAVLVDEDVDDFMLMLDEPKQSKVTLGNIQPIMEYVTAKVLNRPTTPRSPSRSARRSTRANSAVA
jgi:hypothetical protein